MDERNEVAETRSEDEFATAMGRLLAWLMDADRLSGMGFRVLIAAHKLRPDLAGGISLQDIAEFDGQAYGRSAAHKVSADFERTFGVHGRHDRSPAARAKYREAYRRSQGTAAGGP